MCRADHRAISPVIPGAGGRVTGHDQLWLVDTDSFGVLIVGESMSHVPCASQVQDLTIHSP